MILNRYMLREFFRFASGTIILCIFFFVLFDFIQKASGYLGKYNPSAQLLTKYYLLQVPFEIYQAIPIAALVASVVVMIMLARTGEITAMRAVGMSPLRIIAPIAAGGLLLSVASFVLSEYVIPYTARKSHYIKQVTIEREDAVLNEGAYWMRTPNRTINFKAYNPLNQSLKQLKILYLSPENFALSKTMHSRYAFFSTKHQAWVLTGVQIFEFEEKKLKRGSHFPFLLTMLPIEPQKLKFDRRSPSELSLSEIGDIINNGQQGNGDLLSYRIAWHTKFAYPLAAFLISFLGIRFGYQTERGSETVRGMFIALILALSYWFILSFSKALCASGNMHPFFAGWLANFWVAIVVIWQFRHVDRVQK